MNCIEQIKNYFKKIYYCIRNKRQIKNLNVKLSEAKKLSKESRSIVYVFRQNDDFVCIKKSDIKRRNKYNPHHRVSKDFVEYNAIAEYFNGRCVDHKNFVFNRKLNF